MSRQWIALVGQPEQFTGAPGCTSPGALGLAKSAEEGLCYEGEAAYCDAARFRERALPVPLIRDTRQSI